MDEARKKLRVCLICVVAAAVIGGVIYYFGDVRNAENVNEGTLVTISENAGWRHFYGGNE